MSTILHRHGSKRVWKTKFLQSWLALFFYLTSSLYTFTNWIFFKGIPPPMVCLYIISKIVQGNILPIASMGNCLFGRLGDLEEVIKVITPNRGIMEFHPPITAACITGGFPGQGIFPLQDLFWKPLHHTEELLPGQSYYLLPLHGLECKGGDGQFVVRQGHVRSNSIPTSIIRPYRISFDYEGMLKRSQTEVSLNQCNNQGNAGFWKVKLVISPEQMLEILSKDVHTQELIESVRTVAKCGKGFSSVGYSDQWSLSSSRDTSSNSGSFLDI